MFWNQEKIRKYMELEEKYRKSIEEQKRRLAPEIAKRIKLLDILNKMSPGEVAEVLKELRPDLDVKPGIISTIYISGHAIPKVAIIWFADVDKIIEALRRREYWKD